MKLMRLAILCIATAAAGGCASMSADECMNSDWRAIGFEDGSRGYSSDQFGTRRKACAKHGVTADFEDYQMGRREGLVEYCQPARGFNVGANGGQYYGVCDAALEPGFLESYRIGRELYSLRSTVNSLNSSLYSHEASLERTKDRIREKEAALIARETSTEDRILILADLKELSEQVGSLESEIDAIIAERAAAEVELGNYQQTVAEYGY